MKEREKFASRIGFIFVSAGCAVGLGNVWKFPYICGMYGGAAFIVIYLAFLAVMGLPILICEFSVGRKSRKGVSRAFEQLEPEGTSWHRLKWFAIGANYLLMMFYTMVSGWMLYYAYRMITGKLSGLDSKGVAQKFDEMLANPSVMIFWMVIVVIIAFGVCALGLQNGVEKITKVMMTLLISLMIILAVHSLVLPNASKGVAFYLVPDFESVHSAGIGEVIFAAMTHAFFTLSIGIGSMEIFGSYLDKQRTIVGEAVNVVILDTFVALMAGFIIIPACFAYGVEPDAGPSLLFITLPNVFNNMPGGTIWGAMFFVFMSFAALSTVIAVFENILSFYMDMGNWQRKKAVGFNIILIMVLSIPAILGYNVWSAFQPLGAGNTIMDLEDFLVSYNFLPLGSMVFVLFCVRKNGWGFNNFLEEANEGKGIRLPQWIRVYMSYVIPAIIAIIYIKGYYDMFSPMGMKTLAGWMCFAVLMLAFILAAAFKKPKKKY